MFHTNLLPIALLKKDRYMIEHKLWDFNPGRIIQPRCTLPGTDPEPADKRAGYILYIETMDKKPELCIMVQNKAGFAESLAKIEGVPEELLSEALQENSGKGVCGMYPISRKMEEWLKKELGVA
jgi:hypothetical protein